jgi:hypothetical protein
MGVAGDFAIIKGLTELDYGPADIVYFVSDIQPLHLSRFNTRFEALY